MLPAQAAGTFTRTFVSSLGLDTNSCAITAPCASFAAAYNAVQANGIVAALDPGKYGPLTITYPVTINGNGWAAITATAAGAGVIVNAGSGNVALSGLEIDGAQAAYNGIVFNSGSSLTITNCVLQNFVQDQGADTTTGNGILLQPSGALSFTVANATISNNAHAGLAYLPTSSPTVYGVIDRVTATSDNGYGFVLDSRSASGGKTSISLTNSIASNDNAGLLAITAFSAPIQPIVVSINNLNASSNSVFGVIANGSAQMLLGNSVIKANGSAGVANLTSPNTLYSYGNNQIDLNGSNGTADVFGNSLNTGFTTQ
jgi:hypothetical protein